MSGGRIRPSHLLAWTALAGVTAWLHALGRGPLAPPPLLHPQAALSWWQERGSLLATFAVARDLLWWTGCYLLTLWTIAGIASWRRSFGVIRAMARCRLPGARTVARTTVGASALGAALLSSAVPTFAAGGSAGTTPSGAAPAAAAPPVLRYVGGVDNAVGATPAAPPVLRYTGGATNPARPTAAAPPVRRDTGGTTNPSRPTPAAPPMRRYTGSATNALGPTPAAPPVARSTGSATNALGPTPAALPPGAAPRALTTPREPQPDMDAGGSMPRAGGRAPRRSAARAQSRAQPAPPVPAGPPSLSPSSAATGTGDRQPQPRSALPKPSSGPVRWWTVRPGDDLWSIAEATLAEAWGQMPPERVLAGYWWQVVQTNRPYLPNPADPNLLFPGDRVAIPALPSRPERT